MTTGPAAPLAWDIFEEHLDEAAWLWTFREKSLDSPVYTIADVAKGPERRLRAHLDGLVLGGTRVAERLLLPALVAGKAASSVAAWALVQAEDFDHQDAVFAALATSDPPVQAAIARALALSPRADLGRLARMWHAGSAPFRALMLAVFGMREPEWSRDRIDPALRSGAPPLVAAGLKALRMFPDQAFLGHVTFALESGDPVVREEAILAGVRLGSKNAWSAGRRVAAGPEEHCRVPLGLLALSADAKDRAVVRDRARDSATRAHALWALGFAGDLESADLLLEAMFDEEMAPLAAEAFSTITGVAIAGRLAKPGKTKGPADQEVADDDPPPVLRPQDELPAPSPERVKEWWDQSRSRFRADVRYIFGAPRSSETLRAAVSKAPTWRRPLLWIDLQGVSRDPLALDLEGWAHDQR
jgi:uncharacterized protein (TIGR02270 family)